MIAAKWAREVLNLHLSLESLVSLLEVLSTLLEMLVTLLKVLAHLGQITHASRCIWTRLLLLPKVALLNRVKGLIPRLELSSSLLVLESTSS